MVILVPRREHERAEGIKIRADDSLGAKVRDAELHSGSYRGVGKKRGLFAAALGTAALIRFLLILFVVPGTDVFYFDRQAVEVVLSLQNPYSHLFAGIPDSLATPGAEGVFAYLPFTAIYLVPFYFAGDIRVGFIVADLIVAVVLYLLSGEKMTTSLLYLFVPFTSVFATVYLNNTLISILFLGLFVLLEKRGRPFLGASAFGIALSSIQFSWLLLPFTLYYYLKDWRWREAAIAVGIAVIVIAPFLLANPADFYNDVINFQFARSTLELITRTGPLGFNVNLSLNGFLLTFLNITLPRTARLLMSAAFLPIFALRTRSIERFLIQACGYVLLALFVLPNDFFWAYTELPFLLFLAYVSLVRYGRSPTAEAAGGRPGDVASELASVYRPRLKGRSPDGRTKLP